MAEIDFAIGRFHFQYCCNPFALHLDIQVLAQVGAAEEDDFIPQSMGTWGEFDEEFEYIMRGYGTEGMEDVE